MTGAGSVDLHWIPLGAGAHVVRVNGLVYEAVAAAIQRRSRCQLYHSVLGITLPHGLYMVEMAPVPDRQGAARGVVAEGPVGLRPAGWCRVFRYEVRRWREGVVPDLRYRRAHGSPSTGTDGERRREPRPRSPRAVPPRTRHRARA